MLQNNGAGPLVVNDGFDRAWRRVGLALDRIGFTVEDRDRSKGIFFVRYIDPDAQAHGLERGLPRQAGVLAPGREGGAAAVSASWSPIPAAGLSQVVVQNAKGEAEASPTAKRILALLFEQLK